MSGLVMSSARLMPLRFSIVQCDLLCPKEKWLHLIWFVIAMIGIMGGIGMITIYCEDYGIPSYVT